MAKKKMLKPVAERVSLAEAAELMHVDIDRVQEWVKEGRLETTTSGDEITFTREAILRMLGELDKERSGQAKPFPVVAIGASAGGLEAVRDLLKVLQPDLGMAYVVVSHLSPDHESQLPEILRKHTSMPVVLVENALPLQPDTVYVIPPNANMGMVDGLLTLRTPRQKSLKGFHPINGFMVALAEAYQMSAVGIVLSGTASDGTLGLKAIRAGGGWTFAQDDSAQFQDMPRSAIEANVVDFVLSPEGIARQLALLHRHPLNAVASGALSASNADPGLADILALLRLRTGVDFQKYKRATIKRRILRRLVLHKLKDLEAYAQLLDKDPKEVDLLFNDLLINVTSFFREARFFTALKEQILPRFQERENKEMPIRVWVAGCSSGEEAVSIAITFLEHARTSGTEIPVQIFATDLDPKMVEKARSGIYGKSAMEGLSPTILNRYFKKKDGSFQVVKTIRDMCVFAHHDLLKDPPFSRMDLVSCQNVLIYFDQSAQRHVLQNFHYALRADGVLALGRSESVSAAEEMFIVLNKEEKFFRKNGSTKRVQVHGPYPSRGNGERAPIPTVVRAVGRRGLEQGLDQEADRLLLHRHVPASIVVNRSLEVVRFRGNTAPYLSPQSGKASLHLLKLVREDLVFELRGLLRKVKEDHVPAVGSKVQYSIDGVASTVDIEVAPMGAPGEEEHYLIVFLNEGNAGKNASPAMAKAGTESAKDRRILLLEREVRDVREQMRVLTEESEFNDEQLQTAHEEMLSSNEELQSMNEELETSKEELQSTNEELITINDELLQRQLELKESRDYAEGIIATMATPLVVLNAQLRVRRANPAFHRAFQTTKEEVEGVLIHEIGNHRWDVEGLRRLLMDVLQHGTEMVGFEVKHIYPSNEEHTFVVNARRIDHLGPQQRLLVTLEDVTERQRSNDALQRLAAIVTSSRDGILSLDLEGNVLSWNQGSERMFGWTAKEMVGGSLDRILPPDRKDEVHKLVARIIAGEQVDFFETVRLHKDGHAVQVSLTVSPLRAAEGSIVGISKIERDISEVKRLAASLDESEQRFKLLAENMDQLAWIRKADNSNYWFNERWREFTGLTPDQLLSDYEQLLHPDHFEEVRQTISHHVGQDEAWESTFLLKRYDGEYRWMLARASPGRGEQGKVEQWFGTCTDITDMMRAEEALQKADRRKDEFLATLAHELRNPMAPLRSGLELLKSMDGDEEFRQTRKVMQRQVDHLVQLVDDLLDLGRISTGRLKLRRKPMEPMEAMQEAIETEMPFITKKRQTIEFRSSPRTVHIHGDKVRITQIFSNLLHNASKFTPEEGKIEVRADVQDAVLKVTVADNGIGIPAGQHAHVFEMFSQVDPENRVEAGGLGIGLHLVKRLVEMHGGTVNVSDGPGGVGAVFTVQLPITDAPPAAQPVLPAVHATVKGMRVLVVDDNADSALMLSLLLRSKEADVHTAHSGEEALRVGESFRPDTIFMDIGMPGMDGYETCRRMRTTEWAKGVRIIALSGWGQKEDKMRSQEAGFDKHLVKPVDRAMLFSTLTDRSTA
ncbi:MAG: PAS domain S-box protein [Flavobacteriales bacterium]|nr:PAS domain S-box protein [Flavobacteriales bacterium]